MLWTQSYVKASYPVIFLHGFLGTYKDAYVFQTSQTLSWHLIDLPGFGKTKRSATLCDLIYYLDSLNSPFHLVGYSMGGRVAQKLSHHHNCLSLSVISSHTVLSQQELQERILFEQEQKQALINLPFDQFVDQFYASPLFASLRRKKSSFTSMIKKRKNQDKEDVLFGLDELGIERLSAPLPSCPILALYGMLDLKYQKLYALLPKNICIVSIPHAGHNLCLENPKECLNSLELFIRSIEHDMERLWTLS
jgi:pimeloyl-ACP methyl ester carboxylesterase